MKLRGNLSKDQFDDEDLSGGLITKRIVQAVDRDRDDHHSSLEYKVIDRFLMANVGRPWDLVHSEALHKFHDPAKELRQHLRWKVDEAVYEDRHDHLVRPIGVRYGRLGTGRTAPVNGFYVHPRTGLLCHTTPTPAPPFDRLAGQIHAFLTTIKLMDYTTDFIAADWFIQLSKPTQPLVPMSVHYGDTVSEWAHRNGVWLIHLFRRRLRRRSMRGLETLFS